VIHVVTGHICSGKSTFVREHAAAGSVVVDLDRIALALAPEGTEHHQYGEEIRDVAIAVRWIAIDQAVRLHNRGRLRDVWIVHAYPTDDDLARYHRLGAAVKVMQADAKTLRSRAAAERPARMRQELERRLV
jgi:predicted kinase